MIKRLLTERFRNSRLARNVGWLLLGQLANFLTQALCFILLARLLGVREYGVFAGSIALVNIISPYSSLGSQMLFMRYVAADHRNASVYWGNVLIITVAFTVCFGGAFYFAGPALTGIQNGQMFVVLVIANCLLSQITSVVSTAFQTFERMREAAILVFLCNLVRFLAVVLMWSTMHHATASQWAIAVMVASGCPAVAALIWLTREVGMPTLDLPLLRKRMWEGLGFSLAGTTQSMYNDLDKTMLSHYGMNAQNGFYTLAYRIIDFATSPMFALAQSILPRSFRMATQGVDPIAKLGLKAAKVAAVIGLILAVVIYSAAPLVPHIVGRGFSGAVTALHWLCWIPLLRGIHFMTGSAVTGLGHQNRRTIAQIAVACVNFLLNVWWIPKFGWIGAAWSSVASDGLLAVLNSLILFWLWKLGTPQGSQSVFVDVEN